jgi:integrase/recombinase XerD
MSILTPRTPFERAAARYIKHKRALGLGFDQQTRVITCVGQFLSCAKAADLDQAQFEAWSCTQLRLNANVRRRFQCIVRNLCLYRRRTEPDCFVPDPLRFARRCPHRAPVIFGPAEVVRMLQGIAELEPNPQVPLRPAVLRLAVVLLYTAGLRRGELARLTLADMDLGNGTLRIRDSKFHKSRIVPLSPDAQGELRAYLKQRLAAPWDIAPDAALLGHHHGSPRFRAYADQSLARCLTQLLRAARVCDPAGRIARVHDFRHSFAIQALLRWYRAEADVQSQLPKLAMYMGHVSIVSTAYYLRWVPELAHAASAQFERRFGHLLTGEPS